MLALEPFDTPRDTLRRLLDRLAPDIGPGDRVLVKPEWCAAQDPKPSENSSPAFLGALLEWLDERGARVTLAHSSLLTPPDVPYTSFTELLKLEGVNHLLEDLPHLRLIDLETEPMELRRAGAQAFLAPRALSEHEHLIVCARPKMHMGTEVALGTKGLMGLLPDSENLRMHRDGLGSLLGHLGQAIPPALVLIEGDVAMEGNGPHHGRDVRCGWYLGGADLLEVDAAGAALMGFEVDEVVHLRALADLQGREVPALAKEMRPYIRRLARPEPFLEHRRVRVWPGDSCATCHRAARSVEEHVLDNPHKLGDVAAVAAMLYLKGFNIRMGHHDLADAPEAGSLSVALGECARAWAEAHDVPLVGGCPVRVHEVRPALMERVRALARGGEA
ncbi:MAG: DUF362 domain-containing protein [Alphaproteobacteria bacterium]|nr:DUF362 domain-containing protein [Alphaproteobacteria bacterium]MCB9796424.1 DUF362 domain-containing protein [Alphaproteobacteria bacterium]